MSDYTTTELGRIVTRLEKAVEKVEERTPSRDAHEALAQEVTEIKEAQRWLTRAVAGAMITAIFGSLTAAIVGVIIRLPPL